MIARHDLKNETVKERSSFAIVPDCASKLSSFPRVSFAVAMGDAMYESENSNVPVNKNLCMKMITSVSLVLVVDYPPP